MSIYGECTLRLKIIVAILLMPLIVVFATSNGGTNVALAADVTLDTGLTIVVEPSGTHIDEDGNLKVRLDFYPEPGAKSYASQHVQVPDTNNPQYKAGYQGKVSSEGNPIDELDYAKWIGGIPKVWVINPCLSHFVTVPPDVTADELASYISQTFGADVLATIDDAATQANSAHLLSPYMRIKAKMTTSELIPASQDKITLVSSVNTRLSGLSVVKATGGKIETITPQSIDVGPGATDRSGGTSNTDTTRIAEDNPTNATGRLDTFEIWADTNMTGVEAATFYYDASRLPSHYFSTRDYESIGIVTAGSKQTFTGLSIDVETGDYLGMHSVSGTFSAEIGGNGGWSNSGDKIPCTNVGFPTTTVIYSLYATGTEYASAPTDFTATDMGANSVSLTWALAEFTTNTTIVCKRGSVPTSPTDGEVIYTDTGTSYIHTGLALDTTEYFYAAYGWNGSGYSATAAETYIGGEGLEALSDSVTGMSANMQFFFTMVIPLLFTLGLVFLAFWKDKEVLYIVAVVGLTTVAWQWGWPYLAPLIVLTIYCLYRSVRRFLPW